MPQTGGVIPSGLSPGQFSGDRLEPVRRNPLQGEIPGLESSTDRMLWVKRRVVGSHMAHRYRISKVLAGSALPDSILAHHLPSISVEPFEKKEGGHGVTVGLYYPDWKHFKINEEWMNSVGDDLLHDALIHELHHHFDRTGLLGGRSPSYRKGVTSDYDPGAEGFATGAETRFALERVASQGGRHFPNSYVTHTGRFWSEPHDVRAFQQGTARGMRGTFAEEEPPKPSSHVKGQARMFGSSFDEFPEKPWAKASQIPKEHVHEILKVARPWMSHEEREEYASGNNMVWLNPEHFPKESPPKKTEVPRSIAEARAAKQAALDAQRKEMMERRKRGEKPKRSPWQRY